MLNDSVMQVPTPIYTRHWYLAAEMLVSRQKSGALSRHSSDLARLVHSPFFMRLACRIADVDSAYAELLSKSRRR